MTVCAMRGSAFPQLGGWLYGAGFPAFKDEGGTGCGPPFEYLGKPPSGGRLFLPERHFVPGTFLANLSFAIGAAEAVVVSRTVFPFLSADLAGWGVVDGLAWPSALGLAS
jgi:hypothetical protein